MWVQSRPQSSLTETWPWLRWTVQSLYSSVQSLYSHCTVPCWPRLGPARQTPALSEVASCRSEWPQWAQAQYKQRGYFKVRTIMHHSESPSQLLLLRGLQIPDVQLQPPGISSQLDELNNILNKLPNHSGKLLRWIKMHSWYQSIIIKTFLRPYQCYNIQCSVKIMIILLISSMNKKTPQVNMMQQS